MYLRMGWSVTQNIEILRKHELVEKLVINSPVYED